MRAVAAGVLAVLWAGTANAQFQCTGDACFASEHACEAYRGDRRDEGAGAPTCRERSTTYCVGAFSVVAGDDLDWCHPSMSSCRARVRDLQRANRGRRHIYEGIGECRVVESDPDGDGVHLERDRCPTEAGTTAADGCPDRDGDGTADGIDRCPDQAGELNGCPDTDGDSFHDGIDACPTEPGVEWRQGCPLVDADGDGIEDPVDRCPSEAGASTAGGCPDADGDSVPDAEDVCPNAAGTVGVWGCPDADSDRVPDACFDTARAMTLAPIYGMESTFRMFTGLRSTSCESGWYTDRCRGQAEDYAGGPAEDPTRMDGCPHR